MTQGYVYCLTNPSMPERVKIGFTRDDPEVRADDLFTTGVPEPFIVAYKRRVKDAPYVEAILKKRFHKRRVHDRREFFITTPWLVRFAVWRLWLRGKL